MNEQEMKYFSHKIITTKEGESMVLLNVVDEVSAEVGKLFLYPENDSQLLRWKNILEDKEMYSSVILSISVNVLGGAGFQIKVVDIKE